MRNETIEDIRAIVTDIVERRRKNTDDGTYQDFIVKVSSIEYLLTTNYQLPKNLWNDLRVDIKLLNFILDGAREFLLRCFDKEYKYEDYCKDLANIYRLIGNSDVIDDDLKTFIPKENDILAIFITNPWFVFMYTVEGIFVVQEESP